MSITPCQQTTATNSMHYEKMITLEERCSKKINAVNKKKRNKGQQRPGDEGINGPVGSPMPLDRGLGLSALQKSAGVGNRIGSHNGSMDAPGSMFTSLPERGNKTNTLQYSASGAAPHKPATESAGQNSLQFSTGAADDNAWQAHDGSGKEYLSGRDLIEQSGHSRERDRSHKQPEAVQASLIQLGREAVAAKPAEPTEKPPATLNMLKSLAREPAVTIEGKQLTYTFKVEGLLSAHRVDVAFTPESKVLTPSNKATFENLAANLPENKGYELFDRSGQGHRQDQQQEESCVVETVELDKRALPR